MTKFSEPFIVHCIEITTIISENVQYFPLFSPFVTSPCYEGLAAGVFDEVVAWTGDVKSHAAYCLPSPHLDLPACLPNTKMSTVSTHYLHLNLNRTSLDSLFLGDGNFSALESLLLLGNKSIKSLID